MSAGLQVDLIESYGQLAFNLDFYTEVQDLGRLVDAMGADRFSKRFRKLSSGLCEVDPPASPATLTSVAMSWCIRLGSSMQLALSGCRHQQTNLSE